jgi:tetratricopeptide (TPR) repeat protein
LNEDELTESFSYERLYRDIALGLFNGDNVELVDKLRNCFDYLEYTYTKADLDENGFDIGETYVELGHIYLYDCKNSGNAILCFNRALDIQRISYPDESLGFGPNYERLADAYAFSDIEKASENYKKAIDQYSRLGNMSNIDAALCWCKLGRLYSDYQIEPFNNALKLILSSDDDDDDQQYLRCIDEIVSCLLCLATSCARCETLFEMALEICQTIFRLYPYEPDSKPGINNDFTEWLELLKILYEKKSSKLKNIRKKRKRIIIILGIDGSIVPTKEEFFQTWKNSSLMNTTDIIQMLNSIEQKLNANNISN